MTKIITGERIGAEAALGVACSAAIFDEPREKLLLTRRLDNNQWCMPGGGMEPGESAVETCIREVLEETGLHVEVTKLVGIYTSPHRIVAYPDGNNFQFVSMHFEARFVSGILALSNETSEFGYFSRAEIEELNLIEDHVDRVADSWANQEATFIR